MIPNIIHFIYFDSSCARRFSYMNALAVKVAYHVQGATIYMHYNEEQKDNPNWESIKPYVKLMKMDAPTQFRGIPLNYIQYQADATRLELLEYYGGIYMDTDQLLLKPLTPLMDDYQCVMGGESYKDHARDLHDTSAIQSLSSGLIMSAPNSQFITKWIENWPKGFNQNVWANHAVVLPFQLSKQYPNDVHILETEAFTPFDFRDDYIFGKDYNNLRRLKDSYALHMWDTIWQDKIQKIDENYMRNEDNLFTYLFGRYA